MHGCQGNGKRLQGPVYAIRKVMVITTKHIIYIWSAFSPLGESQRGASYDGRCASMLAYNCARCHYFGDFNNYWIADRTGRTVQRLNELYSTNGQVGFVATERVDGKIILPEGIQLLKMHG